MSVLTVEPNKYFSFLFHLSSGDGEEYPDCNLTVAFWKWYVSLKLPPLLRPEKKKVTYTAIPGTERNWYWQYHEREYGFSVAEGHLSVSYGRQTDDSSTEKRWGYFLPWTQWRFVRHSLYNRNGDHFWSQYGRGSWDEFSKMKEQCDKVIFVFTDFDGEEIEATTLIEEREWHRGEGWFKWLSSLYNPKIRRSLDIDFSKEVGKEKGSWKGGTTGHGIEMLHPDELHENAFRRYCEKYHLKFLRQV
jgi:hypothetical protein